MERIGAPKTGDRACPSYPEIITGDPGPDLGDMVMEFGRFCIVTADRQMFADGAPVRHFHEKVVGDLNQSASGLVPPH